MTVIHANDPTTRVLAQLYEGRGDVVAHLTEANTNSEVTRALKAADSLMMLGHGNGNGLFSKPDRYGRPERFMIESRHVQFLRDKTCIGIWCFANKFAHFYGLHGLFSGMIVSELHEAVENKIETTKEEVDAEIDLFTKRLKYCIEHYALEEVPAKMLALDTAHTPLTEFNYANLFYY